jgi:sterol desaturase/sphingolipid hydroxylase (fatty acid hydroxylase superfamily)
MTAGEFMANVTAILSVMAVIAAIEVVVPLFPRTPAQRGRTGANLGLTAMNFAVNGAFTSVAAVLTIAQGPGLMTRMGLPLSAQIVLSIVVLDFCFGYVAHVALHAAPVLWRVHAVHHSDPFVDVTTTYRTHPIELAWRSLFMIVPVWMLGVPPGALLVYRMLSAINALLEHANLRVWPMLDRALSFIWVTPNMHKIHHSRDRAETNSNYGNLLSIYDRIFRTFTVTDKALTVRYGLDDTDTDAVRSIPDLLSMRVSASTLPSAPARRRALGLELRPFSSSPTTARISTPTTTEK